MATAAKNIMDLPLQAAIGFSGNIKGGLSYTPCGEFIVYPLGSMLIVRHLESDKVVFLEGHTNNISCVAISHDGGRAVSGQTSHMGVEADAIVWDLEAAKNNCMEGRPNAGGCLIHRLKQHLGEVQAVDWSSNDEYLCTLGGRDDNALVVWHTESGTALCGSPAAGDSALCVRWLNNREDRLVTCGNYHLRVWQVDFGLPKLHPMDAKMGNVRRVMQCVDIDQDDEFAFVGTKTGDVFKIRIDRDDIQSANDPDSVVPTMVGSSRERFSRGAKAIRCVYNEESGHTNALVGAGDGSLAYVNRNMRKVPDYSASLDGAVTSISNAPGGRGFCVGTELSNRYFVTPELNAELRGTCHFDRVNDVIFPRGCPELMLTCSKADIRVWNVQMRQELLRIQVPNLECSCVAITPSGGSIISGWNDGKIRAFYPESGRLRFVISDAHAENVTALAVNDDDTMSPWRIVSGGHDGRLRIWNVTSSHQALAHSLKEHRGTVSRICINRDSTQCVSASADGSVIVWDLERVVRLQAFFSPTVFTSVLYHPDESQILTSGANHMIAYWDAYDGSTIREIEGGDLDITALDIDSDGCMFVSGGADNLVKVWSYDDGIAAAVGRGHSGTVQALKISPDRSILVSVGSEGGIFIWEMPSREEVDAAIDA